MVMLGTQDFRVEEPRAHTPAHRFLAVRPWGEAHLTKPQLPPLENGGNNSTQHLGPVSGFNKVMLETCLASRKCLTQGGSGIPHRQGAQQSTGVPTLPLPRPL